MLRGVEQLGLLDSRRDEYLDRGTPKSRHMNMRVRLSRAICAATVR